MKNFTLFQIPKINVPGKSYALSCLVFVLLVTNAFGQYQPDSLRYKNIVTVLEAQLNEPLIGVSIYNASKTFSVSTDYIGQANLEMVSNTDTLYFEYIGFQPRKLTIKDIENLGWRVYMTPTVMSLGEVVVYGPTKTPERSREVPSVIHIIEAKDVAFSNPQTSADMLANTGSVFVQKSQMGGGSPVIRGFEANKVLIVLDGVRMNNAIYRNGHLQNVITIDNAILERTEVIYGPSSVIYGSDALGGVMHFYTKKPKLKTEGDEPFSLNAYTRYSSANKEKSGHLDISYGSEQWATLTSITYSSFGDLRAGANKHKDYPNFGDRLFYQDFINGVDTVITNPNRHIQVGSSFNQIDLLQKVRWQPKDSLEFIANIQFSTTSDVPRYDQLSQGELIRASGEPISKDFKFAEWNYGPQTRLFSSLTANISSAGKAFNHASIILAYQNIDEDRITRRFGDAWRVSQEENVNVFSFNADFIKSVAKRHKILYGAEYYHNHVASIAFRQSVETFEIDERVQTRYPDGGSTMISGAAYLSYQTKLGKRKKLNLIGGLRYSYVNLTSNFVDTSFFELPDIRIVLSTRALTGSLGMAWNIGNGFDLNTVLSSAFRAPNVDDFGKVRSKNGYVTIPNPNLVSEKSYNAEFTLSKRLSNKVRVSGTYFYTYLFDAIIRQTCSEEDGHMGVVDDCLFFYNGDFDTVQFNINAGEAFIHGASANLIIEFLPELTLESGLNYTFGQIISDNSPMPHIPPIFGRTTLTYELRDRARFQLLANYNGWKRLDRYATIDTSDNLDLATVDGTPAWLTLNFYSSFYWNQFQLSLAVENILDTHYRPFSSGISGAGRNFIVSLNAAF
ncbi:MAG: TonB-dependent receptor plug domain-containing protein [Bacteroidota bacterium]